MVATCARYADKWRLAGDAGTEVDDNRARNEVIEVKPFCEGRLATILNTPKSANSRNCLPELEILQIQVAIQV